MEKKYILCLGRYYKPVQWQTQPNLSFTDVLLNQISFECQLDKQDKSQSTSQELAITIERKDGDTSISQFYKEKTV